MIRRVGGMGLCVLLWGLVSVVPARSEKCTTQSQMNDQDREELAATARDIAAKVQGNDAAGLRSETISEFAGNFGPLQSLIGETAPKLAGGTLTVDQVYLLDAAQLKGTPGGSDAQFFCTLNRSVNEAEFLIPGLTAGVYGFAIVQVYGSNPWVVPMLLRRDGGRWLLAGIYPRAASAAGHDGLWYWREARRLAAAKQRWNAWLFYEQAEALLKPANFVQSTHLQKLLDEQRVAAPPARSGGIGRDVPLVVRGVDGREYQFTALGTDDALSKDKVDVSAHLRVDQIGESAAARRRNEDAMRALLAAYPELRGSFHGVWIVAEAAGNAASGPFATEQAMSDLR